MKSEEATRSRKGPSQPRATNEEGDQSKEGQQQLHGKSHGNPVVEAAVPSLKEPLSWAPLGIPKHPRQFRTPSCWKPMIGFEGLFGRKEVPKEILFWGVPYKPYSSY